MKKAAVESQKWENWPVSGTNMVVNAEEKCLKNCHDQEQYSADSRQISRVRVTARCHGKPKKPEVSSESMKRIHGSDSSQRREIK